MTRVNQFLQKMVRGLVLGTSALLTAGLALAQTGTPRYIVSQTTAAAIPSGFGFATGNIATDKYGNLYLPDEFGFKVYELPADGSGAKVVFTDQSYGGIGGVAIDPAGALYVTNVYHGGNAGDSGVYRLPPTTAGIQPYTYTGVAPAVCVANATTVCAYGAFYQPAGSSYYFGQSITFDGNGVGYYITGYDAFGGGGKDIYACNATCAIGQTNATVAVQGLPTSATSVAAGLNGDLYWSDGTNVYFSKAGSGSFSLFDGSYAASGGAKGVFFDRAGNLYVSAGGTYEYPLISGAIAAGSKYAVSNQYTAAGGAVGINGEIFSPEYGAVPKQTRFTANVGSAAVGSAAAATTLTVSFISAGAISSIVAAGTSGASSEFAISADGCTNVPGGVGGSCTFNVTMTPVAVGVRRGTVVLTDTQGNTVTAYLTGIGTGTGIAVDPGTPAVASSTLAQPSGLAVDSSKAIYVASPSAGTVTKFAAGSTTGTQVASGLKSPVGVALDGAGNLLVVERGNNDVLFYARSTTGTNGFAAPTVFASGLTSPTDVAVSGTGSVYVSNTGAKEIRQYPNPALYPYLTTYSSLGSGLGAPAGLGVDATGNLFIADMTNNQVVEISAIGVQSTIGSGLLAPTGVAVEASGSVIIADQGNGRLVRVPNESGGLTTNDQIALPQPLVNPYAVRAASDGTLFLTDNQANVVESLTRTAGTLDFGITNVNSTSAAQSIIVSSTGTTPLTLGTPFYTAVPASSSFTLSPGTVGAPCAGGSLNAGSACSLSATFAPTSTGTKSYTVPFNTTATNSSTPSILLTGRGVQLIAVNITIKQTPTGSVAYGSNVSLTATVASAGASTATPTGNLVFTMDGNASKAITLANGTATTLLTGLSAGSHNVVASYGGDGTFASGASATFVVVVTPAATSGTLSITGTGVTPLSATTTDPVTFTVTIVPSIAGNLSGTVTFYNGGTVLGSAPATSAGNGTYVATLSLTPSVTAPTPAGVYQVYAVFTPAANYSGFTTPVQTLTIVSRPTYGISADTYTLTASASQYGIANLTVSSYAGFQGGVSLTCGGLPANAYCVFRPGLVSLAVSGTSIPQQLTQMQIRVDQNPTDIQSAAGFGFAGAALSLLLLAVVRKKRGVKQLAGCAVLVLFVSTSLSVMTACGSSSSSTQYPTPAGTYKVLLHSTATPLVNGTAPSVFTVARITVTANPAAPPVNIIRVVTTSQAQFNAGTQIQIRNSSNAVFNGTFTVTGTATVSDKSDPLFGLTEVDLDAGTIPTTATATNGELRQTNVSIADQTFTLIVK